jgi:hypothetical protein
MGILWVGFSALGERWVRDYKLCKNILWSAQYKNPFSSILAASLYGAVIFNDSLFYKTGSDLITAASFCLFRPLSQPRDIHFLKEKLPLVFNQLCTTSEIFKKTIYITNHSFFFLYIKLFLVSFPKASGHAKKGVKGSGEHYSPYYCICTVHVIRSLNCQYQHMHNFNVTG